MMRKIQLNPSILAADFYRLGEQLQIVEQEGLEWLHIDIMDGVFVPTISLGMPVISTIRNRSKLFFDVHLMTVSPDHLLEQLAKAGADLACVHLEALDNPVKTLSLIHALGMKAGLAVKPGTEIEAVRPYLEYLDLILVMTVEPGYGGQKYKKESRNKLHKLQTLMAEEGYAGKIDVEVDGGMNPETILDAMEGGANILVAGSAVFKQDVAGNIRELKARIQDFEAAQNQLQSE